MPHDPVSIAFQMIAFLFAISVHESAHAWTANRCGDPTARVLGRITLNPIKHIDPIGTIVLPLVAAFTGLTVLGWAKPTPVDPRNFRNPMLDDILTSVAGPVSNFIVATGALLFLIAISLTSSAGREIVQAVAYGDRHFMSDSVRRAYDSIGIFGLLALVYLGGNLISGLIRPFVQFYLHVLVKF
jgi:Peptidase family M50